VVGLTVGAISGVILLVYATGFLRDYMVLTASLTAYGASTIVCTVMTLRNKERFDFDLIAQRVGSYDKPADEDEPTMIPEGARS